MDNKVASEVQNMSINGFWIGPRLFVRKTLVCIRSLLNLVSKSKYGRNLKENKSEGSIISEDDLNEGDLDINKPNDQLTQQTIQQNSEENNETNNNFYHYKNEGESVILSSSPNTLDNTINHDTNININEKFKDLRNNTKEKENIINHATFGGYEAQPIAQYTENTPISSSSECNSPSIDIPQQIVNSNKLQQQRKRKKKKRVSRLRAQIRANLSALRTCQTVIPEINMSIDNLTQKLEELKREEMIIDDEIAQFIVPSSPLYSEKDEGDCLPGTYLSGINKITDMSISQVMHKSKRNISNSNNNAKEVIQSLEKKQEGIEMRSIRNEHNNVLISNNKLNPTKNNTNKNFQTSNKKDNIKCPLERNTMSLDEQDCYYDESIEALEDKLEKIKNIITEQYTTLRNLENTLEKKVKERNKLEEEIQNGKFELEKNDRLKFDYEERLEEVLSHINSKRGIVDHLEKTNIIKDQIVQQLVIQTQNLINRRNLLNKHERTMAEEFKVKYEDLVAEAEKLKLDIERERLQVSSLIGLKNNHLDEKRREINELQQRRDSLLMVLEQIENKSH